MATFLDEELDLSVLDSFDDSSELQEPQGQRQNPTKSQRDNEATLDLSVLDNIFPKEVQPLSSPPSKITSKFGNRKDPFTGAKKFHNGVDIPMPLNTPVNSLGKGTVIEVGDSGNKDYGRFVKVDYGGDLVITYGHLNKVGLEVGDRITPEAVVGLSGNTGRSKGPHLHIKATLKGKPVNPEDYFGSIHDVAIGALSTDDVVNEAKLDLSVLDNLDESIIKVEEDKEELDLSVVDQIGDFAVKPIDEVAYKDERTIAETIASGAAAITQPKRVNAPNPHKLIGASISTSIKQTKRPDRNQVVDYFLGAIDSSYAQLNNEYRNNSAFKSNLIDLPDEAVTWSNGKWNIKARFSESARRIVNAYIEGRKGGIQNGLESVYLEQQNIKREEDKFKDELIAQRKENVEALKNRHAYTKIWDAMKTGVANTGMADAQLVHNLRMLPEALYTLNVYGGDSEQYQKLMERDEEIQKNLFGYQEEIKQPATFSEKLIAGVTTGAASFPKYATFGRLGLGALPTMVYVENLHRGNIEASKAALPMAIMVGATHGLESFFNKGTSLYITKEKNGVPYIERIEVGRGLGNAAPFARIKGELSINPDAQAAFLATEPISIASISPLTRQLMMRGTNAFQNLGMSALQGEGVQDTAANFIVGLTFPVGKYRTGSFDEGHFGLIPYIPSPKKPLITQGQLSQPRILVPITNPPKFGENKIPIVESDRRVALDDPLAANLEKGWQARAEGQTLYLNLDTAALNLLDLRRAAKEGKLGGGSVKESMRRLMAINSAIGILEKQIPKDIIDYFEKNEALIRSALRSNWESIKAKEEYLGSKETTQEIKAPNEIKENPSIDLKESAAERLSKTLNRVEKIKDNPLAVREAAKDVFGNIGEQNKWETPDRILFVSQRAVDRASKLKEFFKSEKGELDPKAIMDLTRIAAFHLEDFYHRRIEPSVVELRNRFKITLGDLVSNFNDKDFQTIFEKGKAYLDSNTADPFFSRLKQDAIEKLPNRMTVEQARNVLSQHKDEFEWTTGLEDFLSDNTGELRKQLAWWKDNQKEHYSDPRGPEQIKKLTEQIRELEQKQTTRKISKQDLIDIIQRGQVRVEESIAAEQLSPEIQAQLDAKRIEQNLILEVAGVNRPERLFDLGLEKKEERWFTLQREIEKLEENYGNAPRYSLKSYHGEKLELAGAQNSKEVKLISVVEQPDNFIQWMRRAHEIDVTETNRYDPNITKFEAEFSQYFEMATASKYKSAHWDEPNVVAHYRSNDRVTTDNQRVYFGEEFQSDWNHDIREKGVKPLPLTEQQRQRMLELGERNRTIEERAEYEQLINQQTNNRLGVEPNPFMQHNWKELVLKRFLRDAAIAKDENGNYKYDGIGWTTARQQLERYGKILEGKEFKWSKNSDGTYTFQLKRTNPEFQTVNETWEMPHELSNISLERFAELTTPEAADFVREQEAAQNYNPDEAYATGKLYPSGQFSLKEAIELRKGGGDKYADYDVAYKNIVSKVGKRFGAKYSEKELITGTKTGKESFWSLGRALDALEKGEKVYGYTKDGQWKQITKQEQFDNYTLFATENEIIPEKIHYLEITPSMRQSLEKEGLPLYGLGGSDPLKFPEAGVRNKVVTADAFNSARENLVNRLFYSNRILYHGTDIQNLTEISEGKSGWNFFAEDIDYAKAFASFRVRNEMQQKNIPETLFGLKLYEKQTGLAPSLYVTSKPLTFANPIDLRNIGSQSTPESLIKTLANYKISINHSDLDLTGNNAIWNLLHNEIVRQKINDAAKEFGYDGIIFSERHPTKGTETTSFVTFDSVEVNRIRNDGTVFNSGLNPDAFIDQTKLLYSGIKDINEFTSTLIDRYGPSIRQYAEDFYYAINQQANNFKEKLSIPIKDWSTNLKQNENSAAWKIREFIESEEGALKLPKFLRRDHIPEVIDYLKDPEKHQKPIGLDIRAWMRGIALSQISTEFAQVYDVMRSLQRVVSNYETTSLNHLKVAKKVIKSKLDAPVAEAIYQGNEWIDPATGNRVGKVWTDPELVSNFGLNSDQIDAYKSVRAAIDNVLNLRLEGKLYAVREKATKLTAKLATVAAGSPEELAIKTQLLDLADNQAKMIKYYDDLKKSGYITLQRTGKVAAFIEDPSLPAGHPDKKIYNQFENTKQAERWLIAQKAALGIPKNTNAGSMYDIRNLKDIILKEQLTPSQFEDLVDRSGANSADPDIEKMRAEVYSKFPSFTYQLKREFVRGYDRDLQTAINSTVDQLELYASSFYSKVGREEGLKALEATGIEKTDPNLYRLSNAYIADETQASKLDWLGKAAITARRGTYLFQLGFDVNQLWMNAFAQPVTQTYGYFYRINHNGKQLTGLEPEHYFIKGMKTTLDWRRGKAPTEFNDIVKRLVDERVLSPEFVHTLIESQAGTRKSSKIEHWASVFMIEGEKQTRLHAAAEGYLVGKEKFGLAGDELVNFITKAVDATQSNPTRGENPFVVRQLGEGGKLIYQFGAFNHMWWENLALGVMQSKGIARKSLFAAREFAPLAIIAGIGGMPLSNFAGATYTLITGRDPKKDWDKLLGDDTLIEQLARYGISTSAAISRKLSPQVPIIDPALQIATSSTINSGGDILSENVPVFATAEQLIRGSKQIVGDDYAKGIINLSPRAIRGPLKMFNTSQEGYKAGDNTVLPRRKITPVQKVGQFLNVSPTPVVEYYDAQRSKKVKRAGRNLKRKLRKVL